MPIRCLLAVGLMALPARVLGQGGDLVLEEAWVRALPPTQPTTAAYVLLRNTGARPVSVTGATVDGAGRVEIHRSREVDGLLRMEPLSTLEVAAGESVALTPGGTHLMLFDLESMPRDGETLELCMELEGAVPVCTDAQVRKSADDGHARHHH